MADRKHAEAEALRKELMEYATWARFECSVGRKQGSQTGRPLLVESTQGPPSS